MDDAGSRAVDQYIQAFPVGVQAQLNRLRAIIREEVPAASERLSYRMPTFVLHGNLVYFAAFRRHIGFYPTSSGVAAFEEELSGFRHSKGAIQFPLEAPLPENLIRRITRFRLEENRKKG